MHLFSGISYMVVMVYFFWIMTVNFDGSESCLLQASSEDFIKEIAGQTSGFMPRDIRAMIADAGANLIPKGNVLHQKVEPEEVDGKSYEVAPKVLGKEDLTKALERSKKRNASALGTPKVN
jgi:peroxin-6